MSENNIDELEELFAKFDKKVSECEQKFAAVEKQIQEFRGSDPGKESADAPQHDRCG